MATKTDQQKPAQPIKEATTWSPVEPNANPGNPQTMEPAQVPQGSDVPIRQP